MGTGLLHLLQHVVRGHRVSLAREGLCVVVEKWEFKGDRLAEKILEVETQGVREATEHALEAIELRLSLSCIWGEIAVGRTPEKLHRLDCIQGLHREGEVLPYVLVFRGIYPDVWQRAFIRQIPGKLDTAIVL